MLGEPWLLALLASRHLFNSFAQALTRSSAVRYTRLVGSYPPFALPYRSCRLCPTTPIFCWPAPVVVMLHLQSRIFFIAVRKRWLVPPLCAVHCAPVFEPHLFFGLPSRPCRLGSVTPIICWLVPVVMLLH